MTLTDTRLGSIVAVLASVALLAGCGGGKGKKPASPDQVEETGGEAGGEGTGAAGGGEAASTEPAIPTEGDPDDHFLGHGDLFAGNATYDQGILYVEPVIEISPPGSTGKGTFKIVRTGKPLETAHHWRTRLAGGSDLKVGVIALMADLKGSDGVYAAPQTVEEAYSGRWWMARISSTKPLESSGYVWVAKGYKVAADAIRVLVDDDSPALDLPGKEDAHFVQSDHWFAGNSPLLDKGISYVAISAAVKPFEGGEGRFLNLTSGAILDTANAWQTKIAAKKDVKVGAHVLVPDFKDGGIYSAPKTRQDALFNRWWFVKVEKKQKDTVIVEGGYEVAMDALRVIK